MKGAFKTVVLGSLVASLLVGAVFTSVAQDRGGRGGRGGFGDPEQFRTMMMEGIQRALESTDEEWTVVGPLVEDVMEKQREAQFGGNMFILMRRGMGDGGPGGQGGPGGGRRGGGPGGMFGGGEPDPTQEALEEVLDKDDASSDDIKSKLAAYRTSREKKAAELKTAREDLRKVLTVKQEALLVLAGMLD